MNGKKLNGGRRWAAEYLLNVEGGEGGIKLELDISSHMARSWDKLLKQMLMENSPIKVFDLFLIAFIS